MTQRSSKRGARSVISLAATTAVALACGQRAMAITTWDGNGGSPPNGTFSVANNWNPDVVPSGAEVVFFSLDNTYTVTFAGNQTSGTVTLLNGTVSWLSDSATVWQYGIANLVAGGDESLTIGSATNPVSVSVSQQIQLGTASGSFDGTVNVVGSNCHAGGVRVAQR